MDENEEAIVTPEVNEEVSGDENPDDIETVVITKKDYDKFIQTVGGLKREIKDLRKLKEVSQPDVKEHSDELDETHLDYLDLKGINEAEDVKVIEDVIKKTGLSVRDTLKDDYVIAKLAANKTKREVLNATPGNMKRAGGQTGDISAAIAKFKETGELPSDRTLADAVVDTTVRADNDRLPPWQR